MLCSCLVKVHVSMLCGSHSSQVDLVQHCCCCCVAEDNKTSEYLFIPKYQTANTMNDLAGRLLPLAWLDLLSGMSDLLFSIELLQKH